MKLFRLSIFLLKGSCAKDIECSVTLCEACGGQRTPLLTLEDACALLACSRDWLRRAVRDGKVPATAYKRLGNRLRFDRELLLKALDAPGVEASGAGA